MISLLFDFIFNRMRFFLKQPVVSHQVNFTWKILKQEMYFSNISSFEWIQSISELLVMVLEVG